MSQSTIYCKQGIEGGNRMQQIIKTQYGIGVVRNYGTQPHQFKRCQRDNKDAKGNW